MENNNEKRNISIKIIMSKIIGIFFMGLSVLLFLRLIPFSESIINNILSENLLMGFAKILLFGFLCLIYLMILLFGFALTFDSDD